MYRIDMKKAFLGFTKKETGFFRALTLILQIVAQPPRNSALELGTFVSAIIYTKEQTKKEWSNIFSITICTCS